LRKAQSSRAHEMPMTVRVKICGLQDEASLCAAIEGGAAMVGFVFSPLSKNAIAPEAAKRLAGLVPAHVEKVGLFVDAGDAEIKAVLSQVPLDLLQLHGIETPERVAGLRRTTGVKAMKALRLKTAAQFDVLPAYEAVADRLLFDSRIGNELSGGPLDWAMLAKELRGRTFAKPWMLAGGLNAGNLAEAVRLSGATAVDVSSGVEDAPFRKSPEKIREFLAVAAKIKI
jgi:phosphoribosylanthranilate isomerase